MDDDRLTGPRLSDADFFAEIDTSRPGLEDIPGAVQRGDYRTARRLFAAEVRGTLRPDRFLQIQRVFRGHNFMKEGETAEQAAERILAGELISCSTPHQFGEEVDWSANPTFNQYREWTWQLSRHSEWGILAERYRATGDERFAAGFVRFFRSWVRQAVVPEDAPGSTTLCWRTIEAGIRMGGVWQWALHSFYNSPHFTDDVLVDWYKSVWEHGWRLRNFHRTGNWLIMEMNGLAQIGILYPQFRLAQAWKAYAFARMEDELDAQIYPDGWQVELSTGYHQVDINNYQWLIDVCQACGEPVPDKFRRYMERMHAVNVLMMMPDGRLPDVNDGSWHDVSRLMQNAARDYPHRADFIWAATRGAEGRPPDATSFAFPYAGYYLLRESWAPDAVWALLDAGHFGYGHQHEDKLNVLLHAYGRLLLTEGGNYAYDSSAMRRYVLATGSHNTIRVDGQDQNRRLHYDRDKFDVTVPSDGTLDLSGERDVASGIYTEGYGPDAGLLVTHQRQAMLLKGRRDELGTCVLVIDRLTPVDGTAHSYEALWHLNSTNTQISGAAVRTADDGQPNVELLPACTSKLALSVVCGQADPEWQGWKAIKNHQQGEYAPVATAAYTWQAVGATTLVTLLYPTRVGEQCPVERIEFSTAGGPGPIRMHLHGGGTITLNEKGL